MPILRLPVNSVIPSTQNAHFPFATIKAKVILPFHLIQDAAVAAVDLVPPADIDSERIKNHEFI